MCWLNMRIYTVAFLVITGTFARSAVYDQVFEDGTFCPIDDPMDDPGPTAINFTADPVIRFDRGSEITNLHVTGLSSLQYNLTLNIVNISYDFEVTIGQVESYADFNVSGYFDARPFRQESIPSGNFSGVGLGNFSFTGFHLKGSFDLIVDLNENKLGWSNLELDVLSFETINVDFSRNLLINGKEFDWDTYNRNAKANFDQDLIEHKNEITEKIRESVNSFLGKYEIRDFLVIPSPCPCGEC